MRRITLFTGILISFFLSEKLLYASSLNSLEYESEAISFLPTRANNPKYQAVLNLANGFYDFCKDAHQAFEESPFYNENQELVYLHNMGTSALIGAGIVEIDRNETSIDAILCKALLSRLQYIGKRSQELLETKEYYKRHNKLPDNYFLGTSPEFVSELPMKKQVIAKRILEGYQFMNLIIYHLYKMTTPADLSQKTKKLISCSRTLWPILNDETVDLSYPDFAFITDYDRDLEELRGHKDNDYYWSNFDLIEQRVTLMNWCQQEITVLVSRLDAELPEAQALPKPSWLYRVIQESPLINEALEREDSNLLNERPWDQPTAVTGMKETKKIIRLAPRLKKKAVELKSVEVKSLKNKELTASSEQPFAEGNKSDDAARASLLSFAFLPETASQKLPKSPVPRLLLSENISDSEKGAQSEKTSLTSRTEDEKKEKTPLRPRGIRAFHSEMSAQSSEEKVQPVSHKINNKASKLIDTIFNSKLKGQGFTFGDFKNLWERLNGKGTVRPSGSGSSHYALLNSGNTVVAGTFAHGEGQKYTRNTVRYLRDALNMIGNFPQN